MQPDFHHVDEFPVGCLLTDKRGQILFTSRYVSAELGFDAKAIDGKPLETMFTHGSRLLLESYVYPEVDKQGKSEEILLTLLTPANERIPVVINVRLHHRDHDILSWTMIRANKRHQLHGALARARDMFEDRASQLRKLAATDELTGLFNRREFLSRAGLAFRNATLTGMSVSLLMADIDHFKRINDEFGHTAGDEVLRQIGQHFRAACRSDELVARYGGEEFIFCVEGISPSATKSFAKRMHDAAALVLTPGEPVTISIGIGIRFGGTHKTLLETLRDADSALYAAKEAGRNKTFLSDSGNFSEV